MTAQGQGMLGQGDVNTKQRRAKCSRSLNREQNDMKRQFPEEGKAHEDEKVPGRLSEKSLLAQGPGTGAGCVGPAGEGM